MGAETSIIPALFLITLFIALAIGIWQLWRVNKARKEHHRSAAAVANHEPPVTSGPSNPPR